MLDVLIPSIVGGLFGFGSSALASKAQSNTNRQQIDFAREQMAWQERMSSTAHEREVADLRRAGLNPLLSAKYGGSSSGSPVGLPKMTSPLDQLANNMATAKMYADINLSKELAKTEATKQKLNINSAVKEKNMAKLTGATAEREEMQKELDRLAHSAVMRNWVGQAIQSTLRAIGMPIFKGLQIKK